jgi:hypothetical protein
MESKSLLLCAQAPASRPYSEQGQFISHPLTLLPGREAGRSHPSGAEITSARGCTSTSPYVFLEWCIIKHRDNFTFTLHPTPL